MYDCAVNFKLEWNIHDPPLSLVLSFEEEKVYLLSMFALKTPYVILFHIFEEIIYIFINSLQNL